MPAVPRYRHLSLADIQSFVLDPLLRDRIAIAAPKDGIDSANLSMAGVSIWASVSDEDDAKIREKIQAGAFPIRLKPDEWASGDAACVLDLLAPSNARLGRAGQFTGSDQRSEVRLHPIVNRMVAPELLRKMRVPGEHAEAEKPGFQSGA